MSLHKNLRQLVIKRKAYDALRTRGAGLCSVSYIISTQDVRLTWVAARVAVFGDHHRPVPGEVPAEVNAAVANNQMTAFKRIQKNEEHSPSKMYHGPQVSNIYYIFV